ncbi:cytokine receptor-like factor 3 [Alexandromys fortis]|uniref:cytokine receptor-like factor 3 n=1 Tax=Alexandromys fortis TaxID=100897 RepID=UPI002152C1B6|nr:cytokine receptor-like factor 3 [Microtus fortis]
MREAMEPEPEVLLQEARENVEAAQSYRRELGQRLQGLREAQRQVGGPLRALEGAGHRLYWLKCGCFFTYIIFLPSILGEIAIQGGIEEHNDKLWNFTKKASHIQLDSLPEVPLLVDVPCLSAQLDDSILNIVKDHIFKHGTVASRPPVQIEELIEKPGGIIVRWCKVDDDFTAQDYRLQFRKCTANHFEDVYVGSETEFIVLHIDPNVDYQFRVCARGDGRQEWSPWSVPQTGHSTLVPHGMLLPCHTRCSVGCGKAYFLPFYFNYRVETVGQPDRRDSIGVCAEKQNGYDSLQRDQAVCISTNGAVFVNGKEMTNQLPAVTSGSTVTFDIEAVTLGTANSSEGGGAKLRVTISSSNREVVFDWLLDQSCGSLYFGCSFFYPGWKVLVF